MKKETARPYCCRVAGLAGGHLCTPTRLGRDQHDLALHSTNDILGGCARIQDVPVATQAGV